MSTTRSKPDFANPTTHGDAWIGIATTVAILAIASVLARLWARFVILRKPGADDYLIICALVMPPYSLTLTFYMLTGSIRPRMLAHMLWTTIVS